MSSCLSHYKAFRAVYPLGESVQDQQVISTVSSLPDEGSFEIWFYPDRKEFLFLATDVTPVKSALHACYPSAIFYDVDTPYLKETIGMSMAALEACFNKDDLLPLNYFTHEADPLIHLIESIDASLRDGGMAVLQVIWRSGDWSERATKECRRLTMPIYGLGGRIKYQPSDFERKMAEDMMFKSSQRCFLVTVRLLVFAKNEKEVLLKASALRHVFSPFMGKYNQLIAVYVNPIESLDLFLKREHSKNILPLCANELALFTHLPVERAIVGAPTTRVVALAPPTVLPKPIPRQPSWVIGKALYRGETTLDVIRSAEDLKRGLHIMGAPGTGKTTLLINMAKQAYEQKVACIVVDPHGDLSHDLLFSLPDWSRVYLFDPHLERAPFSINPLELPKYATEEERTNLINGAVNALIQVLRTAFTERHWGPRLEHILTLCLEAVYRKNDKPTFSDLLRIINAFKSYEELSRLLTELGVKRDEEVRKSLELVPQLFRRAPEAIFAVLSKIGPYTTDRFLALMFNMPESSISLEEFIDKDSLVIFRLVKGELGERNVIFIASALVVKVWFALLARASLPERLRKPLMFICDEFQNIAHLASLETILSEGRKYGMMPILAHQYFRQLSKEMEDACLATLRTKVCFALSGSDAAKMAESIDKARADEVASTLSSLPQGRAVCKLESRFGEEPIPPFVITCLPPPEKYLNRNLSAVYEKMRAFRPTAHVVPGTFILKKVAELDPICADIMATILRAKEGLGKHEIVQRVGRSKPVVLKHLRELEEAMLIKVIPEKVSVGVWMAKRHRVIGLIDPKYTEAVLAVLDKKRYRKNL